MLRSLPREAGEEARASRRGQAPARRLPHPSASHACGLRTSPLRGEDMSVVGSQTGL